MTDSKIHERHVLWLIAGFFILYKLITFRMFDIGGDAINYWFAAKHIYYGLVYAELTHQTSRFGIIFPVALSQFLLGVHPVVTAVLPNILLFLQMIFIYKIGVRLHSIHAGFISAMLFILCPYVIRWSGQILPPAFEGPALTMSFYFLLNYGENAKRSLMHLVFSALMLFWAYTVKETDIYFMPAFIAVMFMMRKNYKHIVFYSSVLFVLFIMECTLYYHFTGDFLGRLHSITGHHLDGEKLVPVSFLKLFSRYTGSELLWRIPFFIYLALLVPVFKNGNVKIKGLALSGIVFYVLIQFSIKSINPIVPALPFKEQYLMTGLTFMIPVIAIGSITLYNYLRGRLMTPGVNGNPVLKLKPYIITIAILSIAGLSVTSAGILPKKADPYYNNIFSLSKHQLAEFFRMNRLFNDAYNNSTPVVSDYLYTIEDQKVYNKIQVLLDSGMNLEQACSKAGVTIKYYLARRPNMPVKSLDAVRKVFINVSPDRIPELKTVTIGKRIYWYFVNETGLQETVSAKPAAGSDVVFAVSGYLKAFNGKIDK